MSVNKKSILLLVVLVISSASLFVPVISMASSKYSFTQKGDELIDGQAASITWQISIMNNHDAMVHISSWHAPFTCDGKYIVKRDGEVFNLVWSEKENKDTECDTTAPQIVMKQATDGTWLVKSELFPWGEDGWKKMKTIH